MCGTPCVPTLSLRDGEFVEHCLIRHGSPSHCQIERRNRGAMIEPVGLGAQDTRPQVKIREWSELIPVFFPWGAPADRALVRIIRNQNPGRMPGVPVIIDKIYA